MLSQQAQYYLEKCARPIYFVEKAVSGNETTYLGGTLWCALFSSVLIVGRDTEHSEEDVFSDPWISGWELHHVCQRVLHAGMGRHETAGGEFC